MLNIKKEKSEIASLMFNHVIQSRPVPEGPALPILSLCRVDLFQRGLCRVDLSQRGLTCLLCVFVFSHVHVAKSLRSYNTFHKSSFLGAACAGSNSSSYDLKNQFWV